MDLLSAARSEGVGLIVREISFRDFQPMWSQITNVTDRQTDRRTTCDPNTAHMHLSALRGKSDQSAHRGLLSLWKWISRWIKILNSVLRSSYKLVRGTGMLFYSWWNCRSSEFVHVIYINQKDITSRRRFFSSSAIYVHLVILAASSVPAVPSRTSLPLGSRAPQAMNWTELICSL